MGDINLRVGDIIFDDSAKDIGVLLQRFGANDHGLRDEDPDYRDVYAWKTYWLRDGEQLYSEEGLIRLVEFKVFLHYPCE